MTEITYPTRIILRDDRGIIRARVTSSLSGHLSLQIGQQQAALFGFCPPMPPAGFGRWSSFHGETGMLAIAGSDYHAAVAALATNAAPEASWRKVRWIGASQMC